MTRILSLWLPTLPTDRIRRRAHGNGAAAQPLATVANVKGAQRIVSVDAVAATAAVRLGLGLADARAICPHLLVVPADPQSEADTLRKCLDWAQKFTPLVALDPPDGLFLDVSGTAHLFGGEAALIAAVETGLHRQGFAAAAAIAETGEAAWALARFGATKIAATGSEALRALMTPLPLAALRLNGEAIQHLAQAGLRTIGDLVMRPRAPVAARFGTAVFKRLDGALGIIKTPLMPSLPVPAYLAERRFAFGLTQIEAIEASILCLARHLCSQLDRACVGARQIEAVFFRVDGAVKRITVGTSRPLRDPQALALLMHEKLSSLGEDGFETGYGFDVIRLGSPIVEPLAAQQGRLTSDRTASLHEADLAMLIDRLGARLGVTRVLNLHNTNRHMPEQASHETPAVQGARGPEDIFDPEFHRPLRLLDRPEPIGTIATVPDGPPVQFHWRRFTHEIAAIEGPERILSQWWSTLSTTRDYFHAEDRQGRRFWLFREGLYGAEIAQPRWFLHGLFG